MLVYCNDNKIRLCHICGGMKKSSWLTVGDLILVSLRDFEKKPEPGSKDRYEKGDILHKYDPDHLGKLKKVPGINAKLFMQLETMDGTILAAIGEKENATRGTKLQDDEGGIEFDRGDGEDDDEEASDDEGKTKGDKANKPAKVNKAALATAKDREDAEDDVNIDEI